MDLTTRQQKIMNAITKEYIMSASPVSSNLLKRKYNFGVSSATLRNEMKELTDYNFLFQPHTSAGRVPTDKAYRFFVNNLLGKNINQRREAFKALENFKKETKDVHKFIRSLVKQLAEFSSSLALCYLLEEEIVLREGWDEIFKEPEFKDFNYSSHFMEMIESIEEEIKSLPMDNGSIKSCHIYIGREMPFSKSSDFSIIISKCNFPKVNEGFLGILGPKRMPYQRNIELLNSVTKFLEDF